MNLKIFVRSGKGAADITPLLRDNEAFAELINRLAGKILDLDFDKIVCIEGRGFLLGSAVAFKLGKGLVPIRTAGKLKNETLSVDYIDYSGSKKTLEINKDTLNEGEKVVIIDDWVQTGATLKSAIKLVESLRGNIVGIVVFMDDSNDVTRDDLSKYNYQYLEKDLKQEEKF
ncbi:hypothetical protein A2714_03475 [Candidatus Woesebacteria bacterium RIFCSPHIGHO2_01_FULL_38_9]|uniref:adenine phosphoribosyltransferase n=2 Tax=Candidatus Woeseibacteriota TaxID=1752722 RepID=A0A1F7Y071_9BACT|nr:MAG: hypothetical protein A2714_03475 [Candidatus Woesebacteria bacterium RIFCSPHIGHO2_01_FULL_38_9]OGM63905.1 MAG: hypothetical protein A2893_00110 [Candidatus Woesebacteria bacterium RIFCSPLOWO2_01_FULL_39_25]